MVKLEEMEINIKWRLKMKATGVVRKIDQLGRVVIPKAGKTVCKSCARDITGGCYE